MIRGAYHYYRPNSNEQAALFIKTVQLQRFTSVLDIEKLPKTSRLKILN
jgi:GH25 family lysozyme M1 (1,4-beta-N-acetylmuramidase)